MRKREWRSVREKKKGKKGGEGKEEKERGGGRAIKEEKEDER